MPSNMRLSHRRKPSIAYQASKAQRSGLRVMLLLLVAGVIIFFTPLLPSLPWLPTPDVDYTETVRKIRDLHVQLEEKWPRTGFATHRHFTLSALDRLGDCLERGTCGPGEKTIILLGSFHFGNSQHGHTSGEDIWAGSLVQILESHNYTLLYTYEPLESLLVYQNLGEHIPFIVMETQGVSQCIALGQSTLTEARAAKPKIEGLETYTEGDKLGCAKRVGFEEGIPMHKVRALHFWHGARHPLPGFTLSPENYTGWNADSGNYYLGYHLDHCRYVPKALPHERRAFILGKRPLYFTPEKYAWPQNVLEELSDEIGMGFEFVGAAGRAGIDEMPVKGVRNLGGMAKEEWGQEVAKSGVMLGIGNPPLSPSPYDAWCLGVPFINPILRRDKKDPGDRMKWLTQHDALREFDPPYVYHVWKEDKKALREAIETALETPFPPFIPERMKIESVEQRLLHLIHHNWTAEAEVMIAKGEAKGYVRLDTGENTSDGLLL